MSLKVLSAALLAACAGSLGGEEPARHPKPRPTLIDPWGLSPRWQAELSISSIGCSGLAVMDMDDDGVADVLCTTAYSDDAWIFSGRDGTVLTTITYELGESALALADVNRDGDVEILGISPEGTPVSLDPRGEANWRSSTYVAPYEGMLYVDNIGLEIADLFGDGEPELVTNRAILSAADGTVQTWLDRGGGTYASPTLLTVTDLEPGGAPEILNGGRLFSATGQLLWSLDLGSGAEQVTMVPVQADTDAAGEVVASDGERLVVVDTNGGTLCELASVPERPGCGGDIDGDGVMEVILPGEALVAVDPACNVEWEWAPGELPATLGGTCSTFDMDGDGAREVLILGHQGLTDPLDPLWKASPFYVLDGRTGDVLASWEIPYGGRVPNLVVADLEGDGSVEIVLGGEGRSRFGTVPAVAVWEFAGDSGPPGLGYWPSATWSGGSLDPDGRVPAITSPAWTTFNVWRGQVASWVEDVED